MPPSKSADAGELLGALLHGLPVAVVAVDDQGAVQGASPPAAALLGYAEPKLLGQSLRSVLPSFDFDGESTGKPLASRAVRSSGDHIDIEVSVRRLPAPADHLRLVELSEPPDKGERENDAPDLSAIVDNLPGHIAYTDTEQRFRYANKAYARLGWEPDQIIGRTIREVLGDKIYDQIAPRLAEAMAGTPVEYEVEVPTERGILYRPVKLVPDIDESGRVRGLFALITDVTELRRAQLDLAEAAKLATIGRLGAGLAHELNQPLTVVQLLASQLASAAERTAPHLSQSIGTLHEQVRRMAAIIQQVLAFATHGEVKAELGDPESIVDQALDTVHDRLQQLGVAVSRPATAAPLPAVVLDRLLIRRALTNLLANALDALEEVPTEQRRLEVSLRGDAKAIEYVVEDSGPGIDEQVRPRLFEAFYTSKPVGKGTGLGLPICRAHIRAHGGTLSFEPVPTGGSRFIVRLPVAPSSASP